MPDNPTLFFPEAAQLVLRRAKERRATLKAAIEQREQDIAMCHVKIGGLRVEIEGLQRELDETLNYVVEPLAGIEAQEWTETEKARPYCKTEQRSTRRDLTTLALEAVHDQPGLGSWEYADIIMADTGKRTDRERINAILEALGDTGKVEWRDGWYPIPLAAPRAVDADPGPRQAALEKPQEGQQGQQPPAEDYHAITSVTLVQDGEQCQRDAETLRRLNAQEATQQAHTAPSVDVPAEIAPNPEAAAQEPSPDATHPTPEVTLDFIRRAGPPGLNKFQLRNHVANLEGLLERGSIVIQPNEHGEYRYAVSSEREETAK